MVLAYCDGAVYLERRPPSGIWGGLWSFPELGDNEDVKDWCAKRLNASPTETDRWETPQGIRKVRLKIDSRFNASAKP